MKTVLMTLALVLTAITASAQEMNSLSAKQKFQVLANLRDSSYRGDTEVKPILNSLNNTDNDTVYSWSKFSCEYIGRSLRYECDIRISAQDSDKKIEIYAIDVVGYVDEDMPIQNAKVEDLQKSQQ